MNDYVVPFNKPFIIGEELANIAQTVRNGMTAGDGPFTKMCHRLMEERFDARRVLLTHSCTAALEMSAILAGVGPGDEVIVPSWTFVSTANAFYLRGAKIVFADIRADTLNMDETLLSGLVTDKTRAIVPVHYAGVACDMDAINELGSSQDILVIEDAAQGVDARYRDQFLGTIGQMGTYSFHETKNVISGEGGALVLNDERFIERAEIIREKGTDRSRFFRGEVDKYTWVDVGSSYLPSDMIAAFLHAQLMHMDEITSRRAGIYDYYRTGLAPLADGEKLAIPAPFDNGTAPNFGMFYILLESRTERERMIAHLKARGIQTVFHYIPLHQSPVGRSMGYSDGDLPVTEDIAGRLLRLPFFHALTTDQQDLVIKGIEEFLD
jgi:dTDP-4-amino-4,6-dideoxygalactose transaminase